MGWTYNERQAYEGALRRSQRDLALALSSAASAGDEGVIEDLTGISAHLETLRSESATAQASAHPQKVRRVPHHHPSAAL